MNIDHLTAYMADYKSKQIAHHSKQLAELLAKDNPRLDADKVLSDSDTNDIDLQLIRSLVKQKAQALADAKFEDLAEFAINCLKNPQSPEAAAIILTCYVAFTLTYEQKM